MPISPGAWAAQRNALHRHHFNPYLNFHRPCLFPVLHIDTKGKVRKRYPYEQLHPPYEKLKSPTGAEAFLEPGITIVQLDAIATALSENAAAK
jgi:hypothetical protein